MIMIFGEITTKGTINYEKVVREAIAQIGYDDPAKGEEQAGAGGRTHARWCCCWLLVLVLLPAPRLWLLVVVCLQALTTRPAT